MSGTYREVWKRLYDVSQSCLSILKPRQSPTHVASEAVETRAQPQAFPPLELHVPADFTDFIYALQLPPPSLQSTLARVQKVIDEQKSIHQSKYQELCLKFSQLKRPSTSSHHVDYIGSIKKTHERSFERQLARIKESVVDVCESVHGVSSQSKKPAFNAEYTPVLEQYFEYNAYPSARDRELLARKSSMTTRQIEVWFQNHRRRARLEGRVLRRITEDPLPANLSLETLKAQMPAFMIRKMERRSPSVDEKDLSSPEEQRLPSPAPSPFRAVSVAAFALDDTPARSTLPLARYTARDGATLFSTPQRFTFEAPGWYRKASSPSSARSVPSLTIEELCSDVITKLHIGGVGSIRKQRDPRSLDRCVSTRRRFALETLPTNVPSLAARPTTRNLGVSSEDVSVSFGSSSLRCSKRHQPYDRSLRKYPSWSIDKSEPRSCTPRPNLREKRHMPRRPSVSSSSSGSSLCSDPPTPRDSPNCFAIQPLPCDSPDTLCDPYSFDFSADILVTSSYPSSTERYAPYRKPARLSSRAPSPSYPRFSAY